MIYWIPGRNKKTLMIGFAIINRVVNKNEKSHYKCFMLVNFAMQFFFQKKRNKSKPLNDNEVPRLYIAIKSFLIISKLVLFPYFKLLYNNEILWVKTMFCLAYVLKMSIS